MGKEIYTLIWSPKATRDLDRLHDWIAEQAPRTAVTYLQGLIKYVERIRRFPYRGHPVRDPMAPEAETPYRDIHFKKQRIIYAVKGRAIVIHTIIHQRRYFRMGLVVPI